MTDSELVALCKQGDPHAFATLVARYRQHTWAVCLQITGNRDDADDALQDALTSAWQSLHRFRGDSKFSTWLYRIAANAALALVRRRRNIDDSNLDDVEENEIVLHDPAPPVADRVVDIDSVRQAISELPEDFRVAIVLREFADMSYADIAEHQGIGIQTVKSRLNRARSQLISQLTPTTST